MNAQTQKIGYVDTEVILKQLPEAQEADKKLKEVATKFQDTLVAMQKDLSEKLEQYKKQESMMTVDAKKKEKQEHDKATKQGGAKGPNVRVRK